jgi:hypothetical protein
LSTGLVQADGIKARGGMLACGGNHFSRLAGSELHRTSYIFRNFNAGATITIESVRVFDANGNILFDFPGIGLPAHVKTELGPNETTQINTADILFEDLDSADRPIQTHVGWSSGRSHRYIPLNGSTVRTVRVAGTGAELSRTSSECNFIDYRQQ